MADTKLHLVHNILDAQLIDRRCERIGRADDVILELRDDAPPRVSALLIGAPVRSARIGRIAQWVTRSLTALAHAHRTGESRVPFVAVRCIASTIELDVDERDLDSEKLELWLRDHIVCRIPGAAGERK